MLIPLPHRAPNLAALQTDLQSGEIREVALKTASDGWLVGRLSGAHAPLSKRPDGRPFFTAQDLPCAHSRPRHICSLAPMPDRTDRMSSRQSAPRCFPPPSTGSREFYMLFDAKYANFSELHQEVLALCAMHFSNIFLD